MLNMEYLEELQAKILKTCSKAWEESCSSWKEIKRIKVRKWYYIFIIKISISINNHNKFSDSLIFGVAELPFLKLNPKSSFKSDFISLGFISSLNFS